MARIEKKVMLILLISIVVLTGVITTLSCLMFKNQNSKILKDESASATKVVVDEVNKMQDATAKVCYTMIVDENFDYLLSQKKWDDVKKVFESTLPAPTMFLTVVNGSGDVLWESDPGKITDIKGKAVISDTAANGLYVDPSGVMYFRQNARLKVPSAGVEGMFEYMGIIVGYDVSDLEYLEAIKTLTTSEVTLFKGNLRYVTTIVKKDGTSLVGTPMSDAVKKVVLDDKKEYEGPATINDKKYQTGYVPMKDVNGEVVGAYFAGYSSEEIDKMFLTVVLIVIGVAVVLAIAIVVFMSMQMRKLVVNPIKEINRVAGDLRVGELGNEGVNIAPTNDEVGDTSVAINDMKNALNSYIADLSRVMSAMAQGDFTVMPQVEYKGDFVALCESAKLINDEMHTVLYSIGESADQVLSGSTQSANGSEALAGGTTRQAAAIEELSASLNEISKRVKSTAENAEEAKSLSADATEKMNRQHEYMRNMLSAMKEISEKSSEINTIINAISDVAFQTNILALNAAVEAARAGESGRGFAVVADEVRVLASKSAEAVNTTTELVEATIKAVERGEDIANMNAEALENVIKIFGSTSKIIDDISLAAGEQADSIGQITSGITEISDVVQQNSATAEEIAASCEQLNGQSTELRNSVKKFRI